MAALHHLLAPRPLLPSAGALLAATLLAPRRLLARGLLPSCHLSHPQFAFVFTVEEASEIRSFASLSCLSHEPSGNSVAFRIGREVVDLTIERDATTNGSPHRCAHSRRCAANVSTDAAKKTHRCATSVRVTPRSNRRVGGTSLALVPLVAVARAQLPVLVLAHLLAALLDHAAHGKLEPPTRIAAEVIRVQQRVKRPAFASPPTPRVRARAPACDRGSD